MLKIIAFFIITWFSRFYVKVGILLACGKYLHDYNIQIYYFLLKCLYKIRKVSGHVFVCCVYIVW